MILVDEYRAHGRDLFQALEEMQEWAQGGKPEGPEGEAQVAARNTAAMAEMDQILAGLG